MNLLLYYLAAPYTHKLKYIVHRRVLEINRVVGELFHKGIFVFSPISASHPVLEVTNNLTGEWETWAAFDEIVIGKCDEFLILTLDGWQESTGVNTETKIAKRLNKRISYVDPETCEIRDNP